MRSLGSARGDLRDLAGKMLRERGQELRPVGRHHVVVGRRDGCRDRDLKLHLRRDHACLLQPVEHGPRLDRHVGVAGLEQSGVGRGARLEAKAGDFAHDLAVPLGELERRDVVRELDRRICGKDVLQEANPGLANAGLAVGQTEEVPADRVRHRAEHALGVGQRNAADEMHDGMRAAICAHGASPFAVIVARYRS